MTVSRFAFAEPSGLSLVAVANLENFSMKTGLKLLIMASLLPLGVAGAAQTPAKPKSDAEKVLDTGQNIVEKPLKDLNLMKDEIPPELQAIMNAPYDLKGMTTCKQYSAALAKLNEALGPDVDSAAARNAKGESATEFTLSSAQSLAGSLIPGMGIVRKISGAEAAQKKANAAVFAGSLRRAFIKGTAKAKGCKI